MPFINLWVILKYHGSKFNRKNFVPTEDIVVFPITLINAFPFISGEVNGIKGKFMFDTGNQNALDINDNMVELPGKKQKEVVRWPAARNIKLI